MTVIGLAKLFKTMNRSDPTRSLRFVTAYFSKSIKDTDVKFEHNLHSGLQFMQIKFGIYAIKK